MIQVKRVLVRIAKRMFTDQAACRFISKLADHFNVDLFELSLRRKGFLNYINADVSGEGYLIKHFLPEYFARHFKNKLVLFDVGANIGKYTTALYTAFPEAEIYSFEPNPNSRNELLANCGELLDANLTIVPLGLSSHASSMTMFSYEDNWSSSHTSLHREVFEELHNSQSNVSIQASFTTLDDFCFQNKIDDIQLLKIDTEGHELEVLKGAINTLKAGKIGIVQFEFGECHVYSRVFLRDFYILLEGFKFYRLLPNGLLPLGPHTPANEIFQFQNIVAIKG